MDPFGARGQAADCVLPCRHFRSRASSLLAGAWLHRFGKYHSHCPVLSRRYGSSVTTAARRHFCARAVPRKHHRKFRWCFRGTARSEEHTSELQSQSNLVCRLLLEKKKTTNH